MHYRLAAPDDCRLLADLNAQLIRDEGHRNPMTVDQLAERMRSWLAGEYRAVLFAAEQGGEPPQEPLGYALFREEPEHVYLRQFFVRREARRQGVGRAAIEHLVRSVWPAHKRIRLDVLVGNTAAIAFWRSVGFADYCLTMERGC
jgi:ribosomal protein S18 acetylase RimI-like enzyme